MHKIVRVDVLDGFQLALAFDDGVQGNVVLSHLAGRGVFRIWDDRSVFESVQIGSSGELVWSDQADLCADALYLKVA